MKIADIFAVMENDEEHARALHQTGFWGAQGAGCLFMSRKTGRFLVSHRSNAVEQPGTWGTWGGAIDPGENPEDAVRREAQEEAGYHGSIHAIPLYVFQKGTFRYSNFLLICDDEFKPTLDWETQGYRWCEFGDWPTPMHFGLVSLLNDASSVAKMEDAVRSISIRKESAMSNARFTTSVSEIFHDLVGNIPGLITKADPRGMAKSRDEATRAMAAHSLRAFYGNDRAEVIVETDGLQIYAFFEDFETGEKHSIRYGHEGADRASFINSVRDWVRKAR